MEEHINHQGVEEHIKHRGVEVLAVAVVAAVVAVPFLTPGGERSVWRRDSVSRSTVHGYQPQSVMHYQQMQRAGRG